MGKYITKWFDTGILEQNFSGLLQIDHFSTMHNLHQNIAPFFIQVPTLVKPYYNIFIDFLLNYFRILKGIYYNKYSKEITYFSKTELKNRNLGQIRLLLNFFREFVANCAPFLLLSSASVPKM